MGMVNFSSVKAGAAGMRLRRGVASVHHAPYTGSMVSGSFTSVTQNH
ncbi:unknown [Methanothermobacter thermautotrophicus str. Delta H]|uniref:Uncharacterized protein n=1 Tax=Methanothermobacter thermautotrophicus (strain ATCC 29096 / DSM 1053 / JCM 10044 / NBRC 100330 / Delta H) TaxID=187420 RepID=O27703_METTH|nr:unknown [Methanothermobacter thermautotrophicus str. Delta H]